MSEPKNLPEQPIRPAATVILLRQGPRAPEVLLVQRSRALAFHGGAWVFPGGALDANDRPRNEARALTELGRDDLLETARLAAVRETHEEANLTLAPNALVPFAHWTTPRGQARRFATWFFLAHCHDGACVVTDGSEVHAHRWITAADALTLQGRGELELPAPTFVSLAQLAAFDRTDTAFAQARRETPFVYVPRHHPVPGGIISLYPGDAGYDDGALTREGPRHRLRMLEAGWGYERAL